MNILICLTVFIFGSIIGSFLNVLIFRYNNRFFLKQRSECFSCGHKLNFFDLIPILSFLKLGGRCKYCHSKISYQYPLVEFFTALVFLGLYLKINLLNPALFFSFIISAILI